DPFGLKACKSGQCDECPDGHWVSGVLAADAYLKIWGPIRAGGLAFAGVFVCTSNPTFNVPWYTLCGQGFGARGIKDVPIPLPKIPGLPASLGSALGKVKGGAGAGGGVLRCKGATCREDLKGPEGGGFVMVGPVFVFREGTGSGSTCTGGGLEGGAGFAIGGFGCWTSIGQSWTF